MGVRGRRREIPACAGMTFGYSQGDSSPSKKNEIIVYQPEGGEFHIEVRVENETVWLTQAQMAELFGTAPQNITIHIKNIYEEGELFKVATCKDFLQVAREGNRNVKRSYKYYNLNVIISVGYRVKFYQTNPLHRSNLNTCRL